MSIKKQTPAVLAALIVLTMVMGCAAAAPVTLVKDGQPAATIVTAADATE